MKKRPYPVYPYSEMTPMRDYSELILSPNSGWIEKDDETGRWYIVVSGHNAVYELDEFISSLLTRTWLNGRDDLRTKLKELLGCY
jgi:hypothetical protein